MIYAAVGLDGDMDWPQWADHFISAYMTWSDIKNRNDLEFRNVGNFIREKRIPLREIKEVTTTTHTDEGLKSTTTHFIFSWNNTAEKEQFVSMFQNTKSI